MAKKDKRNKRKRTPNVSERNRRTQHTDPRRQQTGGRRTQISPSYYSGGGYPDYGRRTSSARTPSRSSLYSERRTSGGNVSSRSRQKSSKIININDARKRRGMTERSERYAAAGRSYQSYSYSSPRLSGRTSSNVYDRQSVRPRRTVNTVDLRKPTGRKSAPQRGKAASPAGSRPRVVTKERVRGAGYEGAAKFFMIAFFVVAILYIGGNVIANTFRNMAAYDTLQIGSIDTPKSAEGVIIRSEEVYTSNMAGEINFLIGDGEKVRTGDVVCSVSELQTVQEAEQDLSDVKEDIINSETARKEIDATDEEALRYNMEIKALSDDAAMSLAGNDTKALRDLTNNVSVKQEMRNQSILESSRQTELNTMKKNAENRIAEKSSAITALSGGILCFETDGLEGELTPDTMTGLGENDISRDSDNSHVAGKEVGEGENIFKIVTSNVWYIAAYINSDYVLEWKQGERHNIYLKDSMGESVDMDVIVKSLTPGEKTTFMILECSKYIDDFMYMRNLTFEVDKVRTGYKIANTSIVENTLIKIPASYVSSGMVTKKTVTGGTEKVSVGDPNGDFAYFPVGYDTLVLHDMIVNPGNPDDVYELTDVETRQGIYIMNTGIAEFYTINMENSSSNSTHTILDPQKNPNISVYDRVVTDPKNIQDNDMLYK